MKSIHPATILNSLKAKTRTWFKHRLSSLLVISDIQAYSREIHELNESYNRLAQEFEEFKAGNLQTWLIQDLGDYKLASFHSLMNLRNEILTIILASRESIVSRSKSMQLSQPNRAVLDPDRSISLSTMRERLNQLAPLNYEMFTEALDVGTRSYEQLPSVSCSTENHPQSILFRQFLSTYLSGLTLDIGCGPQPVPSYLKDHPLDLIYGIDPISSVDDHPFSFYSGFGEFLPWHSESFDTVISATTLDHYYLLDKGLDEANRVLKPGGTFVAWITEFPDAQDAYNPYIKMDKPYDEEHLFHINRSWFIPYILDRGFKEVEIISFDLPFSYLFMAFRKPFKS